jgi:hypothetical protein
MPCRPLYRWLAAVPALVMLGGVTFANRVEPYVFGLPFLLFWIVASVVGTSVVMAVVGALDRRRALRGEGRAADDRDGARP